MQKLNGNSAMPPSDRTDKAIVISVISLLLAALEIIFRIFKCNLGEYYSLFWINFGFLIFLFYWPTYFSANPAISHPVSFRERYRIFLTALLRAIFYLITVSIILVLILAVFRKGINDTLQFWPLLVFWPIYVIIQVKQNFRQLILPFTIAMLTMVGIQFTTPANPTLETFDRHLPAFEKIVALVKTGEINTKPDRTLSEIELPCEYRYLVGCPHRKIRLKKEGNTNIIFFCSEMPFWGNKTTGFVYRSDRKDISVTPSANSPYLEIKKLKDHWFWQVEGN